jgi:hypothetical protein
MTQVSSQLSVAGTDDPIVQSNFVARLSGAFLQLQRSDFDAAVTAERLRITNNAFGIYKAGQGIQILTEVGHRIWFIGASAALSHARQVVLRPGLTITLANDSNRVTATTGAPSSGTGSTGDVAVDWSANVYYTKGASTWTASSTPLYAAAGSTPAPTNYDPPTDDPNNVPVIFSRTDSVVTLTTPIARTFTSGTYHYNVNMNASGQVVSISAWGVGASGSVSGY